MVFPKEPVPGQKLDATWGRDVVRALKRLTPSGGPGMRVTCGPNGTTFAAVGRAAQTAAATEKEAEPHPFKAEYFNAGTADEPDWRLTVFVPDDAVDTSFSVLYSQVTECAARAGWAEVEASALHTDENGLATLTLRFCTATSKEWTANAVRTYAQFGTVGYAFDSSGIEGFDSTQAAYATLPIAVIDTANRKVVQQLAFSAFVVQTTLQASSGSSGSGGGGMEVSVTDTRTYTGIPGLIGMDAEQEQGKLKLVAYDALGFDKVVAGDIETGVVTLPEYLAGDVKVSVVDPITARASLLGKNVNTENFETECLEEHGNARGTTADLVGSQSRGARADHKHTLDDILIEVEDEGLIAAFSNAESFTKLLQDIGMMTDEGSTEIPDDEQMVTFGDITQGVDGTIGAEGIGSDTSDTAPLTGDKAEYIATEAELAETGVHQGEWDRDTDTSGKGFRYTVCCGVKYIPSKYGVYLIFREITVDKYGMIRKISKAKMGLYQNLV